MSGDTPFDAALAALDVEEVSDGYNHVRYPTILGLDDVRAAHRAEVERVARDAVLRALHVERNEGLSKTTKEVVDDAVAAAMRGATADHPSEARHGQGAEGDQRAVAEEREAIAAWHDAEADRITRECAESRRIVRENPAAFVGISTSLEYEEAQAETHRECAAVIRARGAKS